MTSHLLPGSAKKNLEGWIRQAIANGDKIADSNALESQDGPLVALSLVHFQGAAVKEVRSLVLKPDIRYDAKDIAATIRGWVDTDCQNLIGAQQYCVYAYYGEAKKEGDRFPMSEIGEGGLSHKGLATESGKDGMQMQGQRLVEMIAQGSFNLQIPLFQMFATSLREEKAENKDLRQENRDMFLMMRDSWIAMMKENTENRIKEESAKRTTMIVEKLVKIAPSMLNELTGREIIPQNAQDTALVEALFDHLDIEEIQKMVMSGEIPGKISSMVPPELLGLFMARGARYLKEKREGKEQIAAIETTSDMRAMELGVTDLEDMFNGSGPKH